MSVSLLANAIVIDDDDDDDDEDDTEGVTGEWPVRGEGEEERFQEGVSNTTANVKAEETLEMFHTTAPPSTNVIVIDDDDEDENED